MSKMQGPYTSDAQI